MRKRLLVIAAAMMLAFSSGCGEAKKDDDSTVTVAEATKEAETTVEATSEETEEETTEEGIQYKDWVKIVRESVKNSDTKDENDFAYFYKDDVPGYYNIGILGDKLRFGYDNGDGEYFDVDVDPMYRSVDIIFGVRYEDGESVYYLGNGSPEGMPVDNIENFLKTVLTSGDENLIVDNEEDLEKDIQGDLYKLCARFVYMSDYILAQNGISFSDIGIDFGKDYQQYSISDNIESENSPEFEKHNFVDGVCQDCGKDFIDCVIAGTELLDYSDDGITSHRFAPLKNMVTINDYVDIDNDLVDLCMTYSRFNVEDHPDVMTHFVMNKNSDVCQFVFSTGTDEEIDDEGIATYNNETKLYLFVSPKDLNDIMSSKDSLVKALSNEDNSCSIEIIEGGEMKDAPSATDVSDEVYELLLAEYKSYMASFEEALNSMNMSFSDIGVNVK